MESSMLNNISDKSAKRIEIPLNKIFSFLFMGFFMSMISTTYAEEKKANGGRGELTSDIGNACFKTQSKSITEVCANYRIRWKMWSLMGEPVGNYSLDWRLQRITLTTESNDSLSAKPSWHFTPVTLPAELKKSVDAIELYIDGAAMVTSPGINWNKTTARYHRFDTGVAVRAEKGASHNVPGSPNWDKVFINENSCSNTEYASAADAKRVFINGFKLSNLQVCSKSAVYNLSGVESKIYELCSTEEGQKKYKFCPKKDITQKKEVSSCKLKGLDFTSNDIYKGECENWGGQYYEPEAYGYGIVKLSTGHKYEGLFEYGGPNMRVTNFGKGIFTYPDGKICTSTIANTSVCLRDFSKNLVEFKRKAWVNTN